MKVSFLDVAAQEFAEAREYYDNQRVGLGDEFALEVQQTIGRIVEHPSAWAPLSSRTRRCRMRRFPFGVIYQLRADQILIVAILHERRDPRSWRERLVSGGHTA